MKRLVSLLATMAAASAQAAFAQSNECVAKIKAIFRQVKGFTAAQADITAAQTHLTGQPVFALAPLNPGTSLKSWRE